MIKKLTIFAALTLLFVVLAAVAAGIVVFRCYRGKLVDVSYSPDKQFRIEKYEIWTPHRLLPTMPGHGSDNARFVLRLYDSQDRLVRRQYVSNMDRYEQPLWTETEVVYRGVGNPYWKLPPLKEHINRGSGGGGQETGESSVASLQITNEFSKTNYVETAISQIYLRCSNRVAKVSAEFSGRWSILTNADLVKQSNVNPQEILGHVDISIVTTAVPMLIEVTMLYDFPDKLKDAAADAGRYERYELPYQVCWRIRKAFHSTIRWPLGGGRMLLWCFFRIRGTGLSTNLINELDVDHNPAEIELREKYLKLWKDVIDQRLIPKETGASNTVPGPD